MLLSSSPGVWYCYSRLSVLQVHDLQLPRTIWWIFDMEPDINKDKTDLFCDVWNSLLLFYSKHFSSQACDYKCTNALEVIFLPGARSRSMFKCVAMTASIFIKCLDVSELDCPRVSPCIVLIWMYPRIIRGNFVKDCPNSIQFNPNNCLNIPLLDEKYSGKIFSKIEFPFRIQAN